MSSQNTGESQDTRNDSTLQISICTVTWNSSEHLEEYFEAIDALDLPADSLDVIVVDCNSEDQSVRMLEEGRGSCRFRVQVIPLNSNRGFAGGMNRAIAASDAQWIWAVNPDARPDPATSTALLAAASEVLSVRLGAVTPRIVRSDGTSSEDLLDACGMHLTKTWRHLDRGSGEPDRGQFPTRERVFGGTGAATLYRREALDDVAVEGLAFDEDFHSFREDAELAFRLQERGWECLYAPEARVLHRRFNLPERRGSMPAHVNMHSLKNRYLLRLYHQTGRNFWATLLPATGRDFMAIAYVLLREHSSFAAYVWLWQNRSRLLERRRLLKGRRTAPPAAVERWFHHEAMALSDGSPRDTK